MCPIIHTVLDLPSMEIRISLESADSQQYNGASQVFIRCVVLEIELFYLISSSMLEAEVLSE